MKSTAEIRERLATLEEVAALTRTNADSTKTANQLQQRIDELRRILK